MSLIIPGTEERPSIGRLRLPAGIRDDIVSHLRDALPNEGCGLLAGRLVEDGTFVATRFFSGENVDRSPTRFTMDGGQVVAAFREMREGGLDLGAIVHSHPVSSPEPSPTDVREAYYPNALAVIVSFQQEMPEMKAWSWHLHDATQRFHECPIEVAGEV